MTTQDQLLLKPRSTGELLDQGIRLYRKNFFNFIGIIAIVQIPMTILSAISSNYTNQSLLEGVSSASPNDPFGAFTSDYFTGLAITIFLGLISFILLSGVATAAMTRSVADNYLGRQTGILDAYRRIGKSWVSLIGALILLILLSIPLFIWVIIPCIGWVTGPGLMVFLWGMVGSLIAPIVVLENLSAGEALRRAWDMAKRRFWWFVGFLFILYLFNQIVIYGPVIILSMIFQFSFQQQLLEGAATNQFTLQLVIQTLLTMVASLLYN